MSSNERTIDDEDRDDSDWVELKNFGDGAVNMNGWFLTDSAENLDNWSFPAVIIAPGESLLIFASGKDRDVAGSELHTDFRLSSVGEYLALVAPNGQSIASELAPAFPALPTDVSYGLSPDGTTHRYFVEPTPGEANGEGTAELGPVLARFDRKSGTAQPLARGRGSNIGHAPGFGISIAFTSCCRRRQALLPDHVCR